MDINPKARLMAISRSCRTDRSPGGGSAGRFGALAVGVAVVLAGCGSSPASSAQVSGSTAATSSMGASAPVPATYQLHMDFFSHESKLGTVIDPQVFVATPGSPAGTGPQAISHVAGVAPAAKNAPATTPLLAADGSPLKITLGEWEKAAGTAVFTCSGGQERAVSHLSGLVPGGSYSLFVVHLDVTGPGRFTPWGDRQGTTNNFTADPSGSASPTDTVQGCLSNRAAAVVIWHSDGTPHGATPGMLGVSWHNSLITPLP